MHRACHDNLAQKAKAHCTGIAVRKAGPFAGKAQGKCEEHCTFARSLARQMVNDDDGDDTDDVKLSLVKPV